MMAIWLFLFLGSLVHLLALNGYGFDRAAAALPLVPVLALVILPPLQKGLPRLFGPLPRRLASLAGLAACLLLARHLDLAGWDVRETLPDALAALAGLGSLWALADADAPSLPGPGHWLWIGFWLLSGFLDPALPMVGAGLAGALLAFGGWPGTRAAEPAARPMTWPAPTFFLMGLALPKPWWDFGPRPDGAFAWAALGLGAAVAHAAVLRRSLARLPDGALTLGFAVLAIAYLPGLLVPWGGLLGLLVAQTWYRTAHPFNLGLLGSCWLLGLLVSFALHANAWLPGLRHLIWLGN